MNLSSCPRCDAFVGGDWATCIACGGDLPRKPEATESPRPETSPEAAPAVEVTSTEVTATEATPDEAAPGPSPTAAEPTSPASPAPPLSYVATPNSPGRIVVAAGLAVGLLSAPYLMWVIFLLLALLTPSGGWGGAEVPVPTTAPAVSPAVSPDGWETYTDPRGRFTVALPGPPAQTTELGADFVTAAVPGTGTIVRLFAQDLPPGHSLGLDDEFLRERLDSLAKDNATAVRSSSFTKEPGVRHLNAYLVSRDGKKTLDASIFVQGDVAFGLIVITDKPGGDPASFSKLAKTFRAPAPDITSAGATTA